jgi:hypothetical protein
MNKHPAVITIFSTDKGGRPSMPVGSGYSPHACTADGEEYLPIVLHQVPASATFNAEFDAVIEFLYPDRLDYSILASGEVFDLVEGVKRVGRAKLAVLGSG